MQVSLKKNFTLDSQDAIQSSLLTSAPKGSQWMKEILYALLYSFCDCNGDDEKMKHNNSLLLYISYFFSSFFLSHFFPFMNPVGACTNSKTMDAVENFSLTTMLRENIWSKSSWIFWNPWLSTSTKRCWHSR